MKTEQRRWTSAEGWTPATSGSVAKSAQLVFVFGATAALQDRELVQSIRSFFPTAHILGCSTAGEICGTAASHWPAVSAERAGPARRHCAGAHDSGG